ncbi:MAG: adenylate kinase [Chloroflexi bacterium]|nr:adenylate kinase [Chloroflexota bacterium]
MRDTTIPAAPPYPLEAHRRIVVAGVTGAGKTTLARALAHRISAATVELDAFYWEPGWTPAAPDTFRQRAAAAVQGDAWVADGNYGVVRDLVWGRATALVWLDYPLRTTMPQLLRRTLRRLATREELWNGNREPFRTLFFSRESLFLWALTSHGAQRRNYPRLLQQPEYRHLTVVRLRSPAETQTWLNGWRGREDPLPN